jgi:hypothetical protein
MLKDQIDEIRKSKDKEELNEGSRNNNNYEDHKKGKNNGS